ncbi:MAG: ATP-binding protein [Pseudomonadota bacterium]
MDGHKQFIGREYELRLMREEYEKPNSSLVVVYGRRRVGKTRLITEFYKDKNIWKFDGIENENKPTQIKRILEQLSSFSGNNIYATIRCNDWIELLKIIDQAISQSPEKYNKTIFFDEFQYMASRQTELVAAVKWAWDNLWQDKHGFTLVLCGSVASFMINNVVKSSSLYGRVKLEICLQPLSIPEVSEFFGGKKAIREICDLYMFCGGVPEYLLQINPDDAVYQNIAKLGFTKDGYFVHEFDRIFKDIFREEKIYKQIVLLLSKYKSLKIPELTDELNVSGGGGFVDYMENLETAGFVKSIIPLNKAEDSRLKRYRLFDEYLLFYFKFVYPNLKRIKDNTDQNFGLEVLKGRRYKSWSGFAFERLCLKHIPLISKVLKIDQLIKNYGAYFDRGSNTKDGVQIDLMFERYDPVITICEIKYYDGPIGKWIIKDVEKKVALIGKTDKSLEKVLITTNGITKDLEDMNYFSKVITLDEIFKDG